MIIFKKRFSLIALFYMSFISSIYAQSTYSPYSVIGLGEIENHDYGRTTGMANIGVGVRATDYLNAANPAGISGLDSLKFIFDVSAAIKQSTFSGRGKNDDAFNGNLKKLSLGFRLKPKWGISLGVKPFSDVGYQIYSEEPIDGSTSTKSVYLEGSGGLYELYLSNGIEIIDNLSLGINLKFISGTIKQAENQQEYLFEKESYTSQMYSTFGIQYHKKGLTLGATYGYKQSLKMENKTSVYDSEYNLIKEEKDRSTDQFIPETFGIGFSHEGKKVLWGVDFQYQKWDGLKSNISSAKIVNSYRISTGMGYIINRDKYYKVRTQGQIQVGASLSKSYIQIGGKNAYNYSLSTGYSLPVNRGGVLLNMGLEYGNSLSAPTSYIKESYFMLNINCNIFDQWFKRRKLD